MFGTMDSVALRALNLHFHPNKLGGLFCSYLSKAANLSQNSKLQLCATHLTGYVLSLPHFSYLLV